MHLIIEEYLERIERCWNIFENRSTAKRISDSLDIIEEVNHQPLPQEGIYMLKTILLKHMLDKKDAFLYMNRPLQKAGVSGKEYKDMLMETLRDIYREKKQY